MQILKAHYKDTYHDVDIAIQNTETYYRSNPLSFTLDDITFCGTSLGDFQLADESQYGKAKETFCILKWGGQNHRKPYSYDLQRYALEVELQIPVVRKKDKQALTGKLHIAFQYVEPDIKNQRCIYWCDQERVYRDDVVVTDFSLTIDGTTFISEKKTLRFETALGDICRQMKQEYFLKCCFTCQYSDYSPYGNDDYGTMLCYCRHKEDYLNVLKG